MKKLLIAVVIVVVLVIIAKAWIIEDRTQPNDPGDAPVLMIAPHLIPSR